jgi:hypothetical protein
MVLSLSLSLSLYMETMKVQEPDYYWRTISWDLGQRSQTSAVGNGKSGSHACQSCMGDEFYEQ